MIKGCVWRCSVVLMVVCTQALCEKVVKVGVLLEACGCVGVYLSLLATIHTGTL